MTVDKRSERGYTAARLLLVIALIVAVILFCLFLAYVAWSVPRITINLPAASAPAAAAPDAQAALNRANQAATLAQVTAEQTARSIEMVTSVTTILGTVLGALIITATAIAGFFGLSNQRELREERERIREEEGKVRDLELHLEQQAREFEQERQEFATFKAQVRQDFKDMGQALGLIDFGNRLYDEGRRAHALSIYEEAQRLDPNNPQIYHRLGRTYSNHSRLLDAIAAFEKAIELMPDFEEAYMELGLAYRRHGDTLPDAQRIVAYQQAETFLRQAIVRRADYADALDALGGLYRRLGKYDQSLSHYLRAADADPTWSYASNNIASLYWRLGKVDLSRQHFEQSEKLALSRIDKQNEHRHWAYYDLALAELALGKPGALDHHRRAIALTPADAKNDFCSVLDNLRMLQGSPTPMVGLDEFVKLVEAHNPNCPPILLSAPG